MSHTVPHRGAAVIARRARPGLHLWDEPSGLRGRLVSEQPETLRSRAGRKKVGLHPNERTTVKRLRLPSPAMSVALLALFVAMGGAGYAALKLPRNSVGTAQLKANAVTGA